MLVAHRGDSVRAPENTLLAARRARAEGADAWEFDVQLTRDGVAVVIHDESLVRTTDVARRFARDPRGETGFLVASFDWNEIQTLDAGSWFLDPGGGARSATDFGSIGRVLPEDRVEIASGAVRVPTLREALESTRDLDWLANLEIKTSGPRARELVEAVAIEVERLDVLDRLLVSSFHHESLRRVRARLPGVVTGALSERRLAEPHRYVPDALLADCYHPAVDAIGAFRGLGRSGYEVFEADLEALRREGIPVLVYTLNDPAEDGPAARLARAGVAALFTDDPESLGGIPFSA